MTGIGLGLARQSDSKGLKLLGPVAGLALAMFLHALWNLSASYGSVFILAYLFVMVPVFLTVLGVIFFALRHEGRIVRAHLLCDLESGLLSHHEYEYLCTVRGRMGSSWRSFRQGGTTMWRTRREFNQIASELAFHRWRVGRGLTDGAQSAAAREAAYRARLYELGRRLG
jgi:hypothetical protein